MKLYSVILLLLYWQRIGGNDVDDISIKSLLDKIAIPTKIFGDFFQTPEKTSSEKLISNHRLESSTVHYENSNGFVPLISKPYAFKEKKQNFTKISSKQESKEQTGNNKTSILNFNEPLNSSDLDVNRRSYHVHGNEDDFELLRVSNGTPNVATYDSYYDQSKEILKPDSSYNNENLKKSPRNKDRERGKKVQNNFGNHDPLYEDDQYSYSDVVVDPKKNNFQYEKSNYKQNTAESYSQKFSLPRTNYVISTPKPSPKPDTGIKNKERKVKSSFIDEPSEHKVDVKFSGPTVKTFGSTSTPKKEQIDGLYSEYGTSDQLTHADGTNRNYDSADPRDFSDEYDDYVDEKERSQRQQKTKRRPLHFDSSRKLPKEHRENYDNSYDDSGYKQPSLRSKSRQRPRTKPVRVVTEYNYNSDTDSSEEHLSNSNNQQNEGTWNQVTPNVEFSHSNGFEVNQIEKPKLRIVPVNIVPTFDHATALDNSQGFDITNAMFTGFVDGSVVSTAAPLISSTPNYISENVVSSSTIKPKIEISSTVPDVIVGQNSFSNPVTAVLMPNKLQQNMLNQYVQSTMSPAIFAVTPQSSFSASPTITPQLQQMLNQMQVFPFNHQYVTGQKTDQSNSNDQNSNYNESHDRYPYQSASRSTTERTDLYQKKKSGGNNNSQYLASASMSVSQGSQRQSHNRNKKKNNINYEDSNNNTGNNQQLPQNHNPFVQPTVVPAIIHTGIGLLNNQNHPLLQNPLIITNPQQSSQYFKATNEAIENSIKQLQYNLLANRNQLNAYANLDNVGGASNNVNNIANPAQKAQLPLLGAKNVEIINPNLNTNTFAINQIPAAIVTTPIPIFTTTGFIASKPLLSTTTQEAPVSVSNFVNALTEFGTKKPDHRQIHNTNPFINLQSPDRPFFNPINFSPSYDLMKSQTILNNNVASNDAYSQHNLNLVPVIPGGNFYKHSQGAQVDLANKPKLSSDLEKYAEEMFKESLRTIYNSHKWNNDPRPPNTNNLNLDESDITKLRNELLRLKNSLRESKIPKDALEAHQTENKIRTIKPGKKPKRPDSSGEISHKPKHHSHGSHHHHHHSPHHHHHRAKPLINDYLTPPRANSFVSKSPFHDKPPKKRPSHGPRPNFNHENSRPRPRQGVVSSKTKGLDAQASSVVENRYPIQSLPEKHQYNQPDFRIIQKYNYPTFTTSFPDLDQFKSSGELKSVDKNNYDINHQRTHNLMGLLMKNTQLPQGMRSKQLSDSDTVNPMFDEENRRSQSITYEDAIRNFQKKSDRQSIPLSRVINPNNQKTN